MCVPLSGFYYTISVDQGKLIQMIVWCFFFYNYFYFFKSFQVKYHQTYEKEIKGKASHTAGTDVTFTRENVDQYGQVCSIREIPVIADPYVGSFGLWEG